MSGESIALIILAAVFTGCAVPTIGMVFSLHSRFVLMEDRIKNMSRTLTRMESRLISLMVTIPWVPAPEDDEQQEKERENW